MRFWRIHLSGVPLQPLAEHRSMVGFRIGKLSCFLNWTTRSPAPSHRWPLCSAAGCGLFWDTSQTHVRNRGQDCLSRAGHRLHISSDVKRCSSRVMVSYFWWVPSLENRAPSTHDIPGNVPEMSLLSYVPQPYGTPILKNRLWSSWAVATSSSDCISSNSWTAWCLSRQYSRSHLLHSWTCLWRVPLTDSGAGSIYFPVLESILVPLHRNFSCESHILLFCHGASSIEQHRQSVFLHFLLWVKRVKSSRNEAFSEVIFCRCNNWYISVICVLVPRF